MLENTNVREINDAIVVLRELNADEKMKYLSEMREKALHDEVSALNSAEEKGIEKKRIRIAEKLRRMGMTEEQIKKPLEMQR